MQEALGAAYFQHHKGPIEGAILDNGLRQYPVFQHHKGPIEGPNDFATSAIA